MWGQKVNACVRCSMCGISYPIGYNSKPCDVCGGKMDWLRDTPPDADWREKVTLAQGEKESLELMLPDPIQSWRAEQLEAAGFDPGSAMRIAIDHEVDIRFAASLLARGCPVQTAVQILT